MGKFGGRGVLVLLVLDLLLQAAGLLRSWDSDPFVASLHGDAQVYWEHAGRIADGALVDETPFLSAPLYPWFLGLLRALGFGLAAVLGVQIGLHLVTAWLVARIGARLGGAPAWGLAAAALFLLLREPAYYAVRLLNPTLQLVLVAWLLDAATRLPRELPLRRAAGFGALLGLNLLASPPMLVAVPVFALWLWLRAPERRPGAIRAGLAAATCLACVVPATVHNAVATARHEPGHAEFVLLSAQAGVTFAHGNSAHADGTYASIPDVPATRQKQNEAAYAIAAEATGVAGWKVTSRHWFATGLEWIRSAPGDAAVLVGRKALWLFAGSGYGDLYHLGLEFPDPDWPRPLMLPLGLLQTGWLLPAALFALATRFRRRASDAVPWLTLLGVPVLVVLVFWYSPRYRLPVTPLVAVLAPLGLATAARRLGAARPDGVRGLAWAALAVLPPLAFEGAASAAGIDLTEPHRGPYEHGVGRAWMKHGDYGAAVPRLQASLAADEIRPEVHEALAESLVRRGTAQLEAGDPGSAEADYRAALPHYARAVALDPGALDAAMSHANVLVYLGEDAAAREVAEAALDEALRRSDLVRADRLRTLLQGLPQD